MNENIKIELSPVKIRRFLNKKVLRTSDFESDRRCFLASAIECTTQGLVLIVAGIRDGIVRDSAWRIPRAFRT